MIFPNCRVGLLLFGLYLLLYGGFVYLAAFSPSAMGSTPLAGVNVAIWYGFGLIATALILALVYGWVCGLGDRNRQCEEPDAEDES